MITKKDFKTCIEGYEIVQGGWKVYGIYCDDTFSIIVEDDFNASFSELDDKAYEIYVKEM